MARRRSPEEIAELIAHYRDSGLSQQRYCEQQGVNPSTLGRYLQRHRRCGRQRLVRVEVRPSPVAGPETATRAGFALVLANGRRIEAGWEFASDALARLIRLTEEA